MTRDRQWSRRRVLPYLMACASFAAIQGCGEGSPKPDTNPAPPKANNAMSDFMNSKKKGKKKR